MSMRVSEPSNDFSEEELGWPDKPTSPAPRAMDIGEIKPAFAWGVVYEFQGRTAKYATIDHAKAIDFAAKQHGFVIPLFE